MKKKCTRCKKLYSSGRYFHRDIQKSDGLTSHCKLCIRNQRIGYYADSKNKVLLYSKKYYQENKNKIISQNGKNRKRIIGEIFLRLGERCARCSVYDKRILCVDHLAGSGYKHRKVMGSGLAYYRNILESVRSNEGKYQILCFNCNIIQGIEKGHRKTIWN